MKIAVKTIEGGSAGEIEATSIVRIASITKPITAAAVMLLVDDSLVALDDPIARWLPELASPQVVRTPQSPVDDVVPAERPIAVALFDARQRQLIARDQVNRFGRLRRDDEGALVRGARTLDIAAHKGDPTQLVFGEQHGVRVA